MTPENYKKAKDIYFDLDTLDSLDRIFKSVNDSNIYEKIELIMGFNPYFLSNDINEFVSKIKASCSLYRQQIQKELSDL